MGTPIYGVFLLDPSRHSPLKLVKRCGVRPVTGTACQHGIQGGTSAVTLAGNLLCGFAIDQPARARTQVSAQDTHVDRNVGATG